jgi:hypothetical protein
MNELQNSIERAKKIFNLYLSTIKKEELIESNFLYPKNEKLDDKYGEIIFTAPCHKIPIFLFKKEFFLSGLDKLSLLNGVSKNEAT